MNRLDHDAPILAGGREGSADAWRRRDLDVVWHPCTQMREHPDVLPLLPIERGEREWLHGFDGRRYLDAVSSWWTCIHGHAEPRIAEAIATQARTLEHVILAGCTHEPAVTLAEKLLAIAPRQAG
ncbi:MAG TPA: aminotransferase class III-fold pyridoxal phosphate-dependent enzyme, partial [Lysobacter sp.]